MQFSTVILALVATASAQYAVTNGTSSAVAAASSTVAPYPSSASSAAVAPYPSASGTVSVKPSGTGAVKPTSSSTAPFEGAGNQLTGSALGLIVAGGVALML